MDPKDYTGQEWTELLRQMNGRQIKKSLRSAIRREAKKAVGIAQGKLSASGLHVKGNTADWKKGVRAYIYNPSRGTGFLVTVKARAASRKTGKGEKSMHENRFYNDRPGKKGRTLKGTKRRLPILMWAEDGTKSRRTKTQTKWFVRKKKGHATGRMGAYGFLDKAAPGMFKSVEDGLIPEIGNAVEKVAKKCGFT